MAVSEETKRDLLIAVASMLFIIFITGLGNGSDGTGDDEIIIA